MRSLAPPRRRHGLINKPDRHYPETMPSEGGTSRLSARYLGLAHRADWITAQGVVSPCRASGPEQRTDEKVGTLADLSRKSAIDASNRGAAQRF